MNITAGSMHPRHVHHYFDGLWEKMKMSVECCQPYHHASDAVLSMTPRMLGRGQERIPPKINCKGCHSNVLHVLDLRGASGWLAAWLISGNEFV
jgi:hypothetical protein